MIKFAVLLFVTAHVYVTSALPPCVCTRNFRPVCGSDGQTYANQCTFECTQSKTPGLTFVRQGPCELQPPAASPGCICPYIYSPVCGSDGTTYGNECSLNCAKRMKPDLVLRHAGNCQQETVKVVELPLPPCTCTRNLNWVCGTDGVTYSNPCMLRCAATQSGKSIEVKSEGTCDGSEVKVVDYPVTQIPSCTCTRNLEPVCGSDGVTYSNECLLRCAGKDLEKRGSC